MKHSTPTRLPRVYYLASGAIAIPALHALQTCRDVWLVGCGTQPDRPGGRRRRPQATPVAEWCEQHQVKVEKFSSVNKPETREFFSGLQLDMLLVFAFGQIFRSALLSLPKFGCVNVHASLLPRYRGASPVSAAVLNGDRTAGISIMRMESALDAGPVFRQAALSLTGQEDTLELEHELGNLAGATICAAVQDIVGGRCSPVPQDHTQATYAPKITKEDGQVDWSQRATRLERQVRAYRPWPGAWFKLPAPQSKRITITRAAVSAGDPTHVHRAGQVVQADKHGWKIACGEGILEILTCIPEGKREMTGIDFLRGHRLSPGILISEYETHYH